MNYKNDIDKITHLNLYEETKIYAEFEDELRKKKVNIPFKLEIEKNTFFSWERDPKSKTKSFRLYLIDPDLEKKFHPIRQHKFEIRYKYKDHLKIFIKKYLQHIIKKNKDLNERNTRHPK